MPDSRISRSASRALWLAELALALDDAHRLVASLGRWEGGSAENAAVRSRLLAAMAEVEALRRGLPSFARPIDPKRIDHPRREPRPKRDPPA